MKSNNLFHHLDKKRAEQHVIPLSRAVEYAKRFREALRRNADKLKPIFDLPRAEAFDRNAIELLLKQKGAESIRFYYGVDENNLVKMMLVPVDKNGRDIFVQLVKSKNTGRVSGAMSGQDAADEDEEQEDTAQDQEMLSAAETTGQDVTASGAEDAQVVNSGQRCPHACDALSVLNDQE